MKIARQASRAVPFLLLLAPTFACSGNPKEQPSPDGGVSVDAGSEGSASTCGNQSVEGDELCDGPPVACTDLGSVWASGTAKCRADCGGYDTTACTPGQAVETIYPAKRDPVRWQHALCNDQTPFVFQVWMSPVRSNQWVVSFEGGGQCDGKYNTCAGRSKGLVSSSGAPADHSGTWTSQNATVLNRDASVNPTFANANYVFVNYCSSDGWSGTNTTPRTVPLKNGETGQYVFTGRLNAKAMVEVLFRNYGLNDDTSELLITGNSAGGFGAFIDTDLFAARMPKTIARRKIAVAPSASWLIRFDDPKFPYHGIKNQTLDQISAEVVDQIYAFDTNPRCLALAQKMGVGKAACQSGLLAWTALTQKAPVGWGIRVLVAKNRLDQGQMNDFGIPTADTVDPDALAARKSWYDLETQSMATLDWLYAPADPQTSASDPNLHGIIADEKLWPYEPPGHPGQSIENVLTAFWNDETPIRVEYEGETPHLDRAQ